MGTARTIGRAAGLLLAAATVLTWTEARAAVVFPGKLAGDAFEPDGKVKHPCFEVRYSTITAAIDGARATTTIEEQIAAPAATEVQAVCIVPLPAGVVEKDIVSSSPEMKYLGVEEARAMYETVARGAGTTKLLALAGRPALLARAFTLGTKSEIHVVYSHAVAESKGLHAYACPVPETGLAASPVARLTIDVSVKNVRALRAMFSPTHEAEIERKGLFEAQVRVAADNWIGGGQFRLVYVADNAPLGLRMLAHREKGEPRGYFMLIGNPTGDPKGGIVIEKDVLFVLDTSGSMRGEKMEQARAAVEYCLKNLNPGDRFNIVTFGTKVASFRKALVTRTDEAVEAARVFIDEIVPVGRTNIDGALARGLAGTPRKGRPRIMIFLTDGTPTAGERVPEKIIGRATKGNTSGTRIFVMGVGHDVNAHLLDRLAEDTDGGSEYVGPEEEIDVKVAALYNRLSHPVLTSVKVAFGDLMTTSVYPRKVPALFRGSGIMITGRYRGGGTHTVTVTGSLAGEKKTHSCTAVFPEGASPAHEYVASLWASRKIGYLLQEIRLHGENTELIEEVVRLSRAFGIVTEYTSFIAAASEDLPAPKLAEEVTKRLAKARAETSGRWAVNQAENDKALQGRMVAAQTANTYIDRQGRVQRADNIRQAGRRVFYLRNGRWEDAEAKGDRKVKKVKLFSKEYFELVRTNDEFREAQSVGADLSINIGDQRVVVEK
jgi:Ca-activated chloride channel family protein